MTDLSVQPTLAQLFSKDPNKYTLQDRRALIAAYRERRKQFNLGQLQAGSAKAPSAKTLAVMKEVKADISLDL